MVLALGHFQHLGLDRLAVDLQSQLAAGTAATRRCDHFFLRAGVDDAQDFRLMLLGEQLTVCMPRRQIVRETLDLSRNELDARLIAAVSQEIFASKPG